VATIDRALAILGDDLQSADLRVLHLVNRSSHLFDLDRLEDADAALFEARRLVERIGTARLQTVHTFAIEYSFLSGRWDNAVAELESGAGSFETFYYYEPAISRGVAALIAGHRDNLLVLRSILADYADQDLLAADIRANSAWLILARALLAERSSDEHRAFTELAPVLEYTTELDNVHTLLPDLVRLAIATGRADFAASAAAVAAEMTKGRAPYYHAIAAHCRSLAEGNPELLSATIESYFRHARRPFELARALEDAAVLLAQRGQRELARPCLSESVDLYATLGAAWDIRRADTRLRALGVRRGSRGPRHRPATGWDALTPTERTVADLVAEGRSNPDIAGQLFLSRSTVQTHVSHILAKLALHSRGQVAHLVLQHAYPGATEPLQ
jgi:DNA-binding NarL/FixJ family response regulator